MIPFQSQILAALIAAVLASCGTANYLSLKHDAELNKIKIASQSVKEKAQETVLRKTEQATTITVDQTAQLSKELLDAQNTINHLQRGIANGTLGMRVNVLAPSRPSPDVSVPGDTTTVREVISAELDPTTANALIDITKTGDEYAIKYNRLYAWCAGQIANEKAEPTK